MTGTTPPPPNITSASWYRLISPSPKPETWDLCVGNSDHLGWQRCWAFVLTHNLGSRELSIVWAIGYAMQAACEDATQAAVREAYEQGWNDACADVRQNRTDPSHPIGERHRYRLEDRA